MTLSELCLQTYPGLDSLPPVEPSCGFVVSALGWGGEIGT